MKIEKLVLRNFRNIQETVLQPEPTINFLVGSNGQGKTSLIEAIGFLSTLRSFREAKAASIVRNECTQAEVICSVASESTARVEEISSTDGHTLESSQQLHKSPQINDLWKTELRVLLEKIDEHKASKKAFINQKLYRSSTHYLSQRFGSFELGFHSVIFNPSDHDLVRGTPAVRRAYLDRTLAAEDIDYLKALQKYQRLLDQRNILLKSKEPVSEAVLAGFTEPLCSVGSLLTHKRLEWVQRLASILSKTLQRIAPNQPQLRLAYLSNWAPSCGDFSFNNNELYSVHFTGQGHVASLELLEQSFWSKISALSTAERRSGCTLVGPHRDDWAFFLGDQALKGQGSQGEVRSSLLALKLSEIELFRERTGHRPLFLLDDFSSELDRERRSFLMKFLTETDLQTFVTTTDDSSLVGKHFWVRNGAVMDS